MNYFNISADVLGLIVCFIVIFCSIISTKIQKQNVFYHILVFITLLFYISSNLIGLIFKGTSFRASHTILLFSNFFEFFFGILLSFVFTLYLFYYLEIKIDKKRLILLILLYLPSIVMLIINLFNKMYYYIDMENYYHRGKLFIVSQLFGIIYQLFNIIIFLRHKKKLDKLERLAFWLYFILPLVGLIIQTQIYGIYSFLLADVIAAIIMYIIMLYVQVLKYVELEHENQEAQINIMLSQIQPHFLYNTLSSIIGICDDSKKTKEAITDFAKYLRVNLDSLKRKNPIPINQELIHVKNYVNLEKLRFEDRLHVDYDIKADNFFIPPLTIQILVENSIKHGLTPKEDGGHILVETFCDDYYNYIRVTDDGVGFEMAKHDSLKSHVGLSNLSARLKTIVNGKILIESKPNNGTSVTIEIPKGD